MSKYKDKIFMIPNMFSFFRIALIPLMVWLYCVKQKYIKGAIDNHFLL